jgi:3-phosphoshikimate 1-carboxyvinyltransferase
LKAIIHQSEIDGVVRSPPSKSYTHRALVCGLLSKGITKITEPLICDDTLATLNASRMMGASIQQGDIIEIQGPTELQAPTSEIDCQGSGTSLRIFTALAALTNGSCVLTGNTSLQARPVADLLDGLQQLGIDARSVLGNGKPPIIIQGRGLRGGVVRIRGDVTSQYITGLLFACSRGKDHTRVELNTPLESRPYVEMTLEVMRHFHVCATPSDTWNHIDVPGLQEYQASDFTVEGDYSSAAFLLAAGALAGEVVVTGLNRNSVQGDAIIIDLLQSMKASIKKESDGVAVNKSETRAIDIDASNAPDLVPVMTVLGTQANGVTIIHNARRLMFKESDRIASISQELRKMGALIEEFQECLRIRGPTPLHGALIDPHDDHRIAMAGIIAGLVAEGTTVVENIDCISKSYPRFIQDMQNIGAQIETKSSVKEE